MPPDPKLLGVSTSGFMRGLAVFLRMLGVTFRYLGDAMVNFYDIVIFAPLWLETQFKSHLGGDRRPSRGATLRETS